MQSYVGLDCDPVAHEKAKANIDLIQTANPNHLTSSLKTHTFLQNCKKIKSTPSEVDDNLLISGINGILMDLGISSMQSNTKSILAEATIQKEVNDQVSTFLSSFPTQLYCTAAIFSPRMRVFWCETQTNSSSDVLDHRLIEEKIKSAFSNIYLSDLNGLIQFWAPAKTTSGRWILSTFDQPFALEHLDPSLKNYRFCCMRYGYCIDDHVNSNNDNEILFEQEDDSMIISGASAATAFLTHLPEVVQDLRVHNQGPLVSCALKYGFTSSLMLPVFYHPSVHSSSSCVGVVECCMKHSGLVVIFNQLKSALERVGLSTFHIQECQPYKTICGLKQATEEIKDALEIVCEAHHFTLGQVWIAYARQNHSCFLSETRAKQLFGLKLIGYCVHLDDDYDDDLLSLVKEYYYTCDMFPLKMGEGLPGKTLETFEPHLCANVNELRDNGLLSLIPVAYSCLVICLRSTHTGDVDYAFEFLWPQRLHSSILLESLLITLKRCLPSFKFACGAQLRDILHIEDVGYSTASGIGFFERNRLPQIPKALGQGRRSVTEEHLSCLAQEEHKQQIGRSMNEAARNRTVFSFSLKCKSRNVVGISKRQGRKFVKRKLSDSWESQEANTACQEQSSSSSSSVNGEPKMIVKLQFGDKRALLYLPLSSKYADFRKNIDEKYKLSPRRFKLEHFFDCYWVELENEMDWQTFIEIWRSFGNPTMRVRVGIYEN